MRLALIIMLSCAFLLIMTCPALAEEDATTKVLKSGLVGAGTGAIAAGMSGGKAGKGALIGAGTGVIGSVLLDAITGSDTRRRRYEGDYEAHDNLDEFYEEPQEDATSKVLKSGLVGAGTGAIAAGTTGGKAGQGALIGAGTGVIGNALLDSITKTGTERKGRQYRRYKDTSKPKSKVIRKYDENGNLVYEEIIPVE